MLRSFNNQSVNRNSLVIATQYDCYVLASTLTDPAELRVGFLGERGDAVRSLRRLERHLKSSFSELTDVSISLLSLIHIYACSSNRAADIVIFLYSIAVWLKKFIGDSSRVTFSAYLYAVRMRNCAKARDNRYLQLYKITRIMNIYLFLLCRILCRNMWKDIQKLTR